MKKLRVHWKFPAWLAALALLAGVYAPQVSAEENPDGKTYVFAAVPQYESRKMFAVWQPILDALQTKTGLKFELDGSPSISAFERLLEVGKADFIYANPYQYLKARDQQRYHAILRDGSRNLRGIVVVHKDSVVNDVKALQGQAMAFPAPNAMGATLLVRSELEQHHRIRVDPFFVKTHSSVYLQVATGRYPAGGGVQSTLQRQPASVKDALKVIYATQAIKPHPIAVHPRVSAADVARVKKALLEISASESARALLAKVPFFSLRESRVDDYDGLERLPIEKFIR